VETNDDLELKNEVEDRKINIMARIHHFLKIWQGSKKLRATQKETCTQTKQVTAIGYISDTEVIIKVSWSNFQPAGVATFKLSERSPLPPAVSANDLPGGQPQVVNVCRIGRIDYHPFECDGDSAPECFSDMENCLNWNGSFDNSDGSENDCMVVNESDKEPGNGIKASGTPEHHIVSTLPNVPGLILPIRRSMKKA
jgi:hypothetical protein